MPDSIGVRIDDTVVCSIFPLRDKTQPAGITRWMTGEGDWAHIASHRLVFVRGKAYVAEG